jgi:hypothetical protein
MALGSSILTGGAATRSDSLSGLNPEYTAVIERMLASAPPDIAKELKITSAYRSPKLQAQLWERALAKYGSPEKARKWVAPPGRSQHGSGNAIDWKYSSDRAKSWVRANAGNFGATFPLGNEPWHMELAGARGGGTPVQAPAGISLASNPVAAMASPAAVPGAPAAAKPESPIAKITRGLTGGSAGQEAQPDMMMQLAPASISAETSEPSAGAAQLMMALMADRQKKRGLTLTGMG